MAIETKYLIKKIPIFMKINFLGDTDGSFVITAVKNNCVLKDIKVTCAHPDPYGFFSKLCKKLTTVFNNQQLQCFVQLTSKHMSDHDTSFCVTIKSDIDLGQTLKETLGESVALQASITLFGEDSSSVQTHEMLIPAPRENEITCADVTYDERLDEILKSFFRRQTQNEHSEVPGEFSLFVLSKNHSTVQSSEELTRCMNKDIFQQEIATDLVILPGNGGEIKCHRSFLMAQSDVFRTKLKADAEKVEMPNTDEEIRAFLAYLYHRDISEAEKDSKLALELLKLGVEYKVWSLQESMQNLMLFKPDTWYNAEVALKLFLSLDDFEGPELLKKKAMLAIKKNFLNLKSTQTYKKLVENDVDVFKRLFEFSMTL